MIDMLLLLIFGLLSDSSLTVAQQVCTSPSIGSNVRVNLSNSESIAYYLNTARPASCNGTISSVDYCYYGPSQYSSDSRIGNWVAVVAPYRLQPNGSYSRVSNRSMFLLKGDHPRLSDRILLNFNCDTYVPRSTMRVQEGDVFGALLITDQIQQFIPSWAPVRVHGLDLVGDSGDGYLMMNKTLNQKEVRNLGDEIVSNDGINLPSILDGLTLDTEMRVLHVYANITPESDPADHEYSTQPPGISMGGSSPTGITIAAVLGVIVIVVILLGIAILLAVLHRRVRKRSRVSTKSAFSLQNTTLVESEGYSEPIDSRVVTTELNEYAAIGPNASKAAKHGTMEGDHFYFTLDHFYFVLEGPYTELLEKNKTEDIYEDVTRYCEPAKQESDLYSQIKSFGIRQINRDSIQIQTHLLGSGQFGSVKSGIWNTGKSEVKVAVKSLNQGISEETRVKFLQEAAIMAQFKHPNVALLYGVVIEGEPIMLVVELVEKGDLRKYLMSIKSNLGEISSDVLPNLLLSFSQHVALGMQYLSGKGFVHRDLAARNILVSKDNICKVADFGMSRDLADENYYVSHGGMIPVKWTAPEAINYKKYSTASDVWSYGCLLYEIWSLGCKPFEKDSNLEVIRMLDEGMRLPPPPGCPKMIYELMIQCWHPTATSRPSFRELFLALTGDKSQVLLIPQTDDEIHPLAGVLGSPLEAGKNMYKDLQNKYII